MYILEWCSQWVFSLNKFKNIYLLIDVLKIATNVIRGKRLKLIYGQSLPIASD